MADKIEIGELRLWIEDGKPRINLLEGQADTVAIRDEEQTMTTTRRTDRPIIFSGPMIQAILDGRKAMTRRVIKPQPDKIIDGRTYWYVGGFRPPTCPYGEAGDTLWVRETHCIVQGSSGLNVAYRADMTTLLCDLNDDGWPTGLTSPRVSTPEAIGVDASEGWVMWKPSIHMPRWASRISLRVTAVRVERLQDISEADAIAEGVPQFPSPIQPSDENGIEPFWCPTCRGTLKSWGDYDCGDCDTSRKLFLNFWDSINAKRGFSRDSNPWVWCISSERIEIDEATGKAEGK